MPQEWPITFSPGQGPTGEGGTRTSPQADGGPIYEYVEGPMGASQRVSPGDTLPPAQSQTPQTASPAVMQGRAVPSGVTFPPPVRPSAPGRGPRLRTRQLWEGTVTDVRDNGFVAVLRDKTNPSNPDERVTFEFDRAEVSPDDRSLISPGAAFFYVVGTESTSAGVRSISMLQFRRLPAWTQRGVDRALGRARLLRERLTEQD